MLKPLFICSSNTYPSLVLATCFTYLPKVSYILLSNQLALSPSTSANSDGVPVVCLAMLCFSASYLTLRPSFVFNIVPDLLVPTMCLCTVSSSPVVRSITVAPGRMLARCLLACCSAGETAADVVDFNSMLYVWAKILHSFKYS